jgi:hypothetical protein
MRANGILVLLALCVLLSLGCGEKPPPKTALDLKAIPPEILKVAREKLPGVTFDSAYREPSGSYELRGKDKTGKVREIDIRPDGTVEELN